ncbi:acyltransferase domain-containing protein [Agrococcus jejuensis]|uniref:acyltransferase domain-containing protein n=1 Tax=Agrococcus jejuensis TaxID=399736 RepID=UPI0011AADE4C|nr:acyltransferase domain-containing protein [Agrococcus jejuensis]
MSGGVVGVDDLRARLAAPPLDALDLDDVDRALVVDAIGALDDDDAAQVAAASTALLAGIGRAERSPAHPFAALDRPDARAPGMLPILALVATAADVVAWLQARGLDEETASSGVADLGQQLRVHRRATGVGGIDTADWLASPWSGALLRHGALQVEHVRHPRLGWVRSLHVPADAPLDRASVDASIAASAVVGALAFPERTTDVVHCASWMLDPWIVEALPGSRLAALAARFEPVADDEDAADDVLWFVWGRRPPWPALAALPRDTSLRRVLAARIEAGGRPIVREGVLAA